MRRRLLAALGLTLAVGCSGGGKGSARNDAETDATTDVETNGDAPHDVIVIGNGGSSPDASPEVAEAGLEAPPPDTRPDAHPDAGDGNAAEVAVQSNCPAQINALVVGSGPVTGTLSGASNNPIVSCQGGVITDGPDAFYTMTLTQTTTVDLHVTSAVETLIAVRTGPCSDSISEVACGQDPALDVLPTSGDSSVFDAGFGGGGFAGFGGPGFDASSGADASSGGGSAGAAGGTAADASIAPDAGATTDAGASLGHDSDLRVRLAAGTYTIVVDTFASTPPTSASYRLTATAVMPLPNGTCATPTLLASGTTAADQPLDLAGSPSSVCGTNGSALFYSVGVPPGQRLTARATPKLGDRAWMPRLMAFSACSSSSTCLGQGHSAAGTTQELDWTNNGSDWQLVILAVMSDGPVVGATFDLSVLSIDLTATCSRPTQLKDGLALLGQDLSTAPSTTVSPCNNNTSNAFFYSATLLPMQTVEIFIEPSSQQQGNPFFIDLGMITTCDGTSQCQGGGNEVSFTNGSNATTTALFEVTPSIQGFSTTFDLHVSIPQPPAHITVTPTSGLVTSESGTTATFTIVLASPPTANVTIALSSSKPTEGSVSPASVTFTTANWNVAQTVTVTGVDDSVPDGPQKYTIVTAAAVSSDPRYQGMDADDVSATNLDNDPGLDLVGADDVVTSESGATATFTVQLNKAPTANVTVPLSSSNLAEGNVSPAQLVFTTANWNVPQTVTVTGVDDSVADGTQAYSIVTGALVSTDPTYSGQNPPDIAAHNRDDDYGAVALKLISGSLTCSVGGRFPIAVDEFNELYIVENCQTGLFLVTSTDGGVTFTDPALIPGTTDAGGGAIELGAGSGGFVYLAYETDQQAISFVRSTDGGATWSTGLHLAASSNNLHLASAKQTVAVLTDGTSDGSTTLLWRSVDGGATFPSPTWIPDSNLVIGVGADGMTEWLLELSGNTNLQTSTDAGATFTTLGSLGFSLFPVTFGKKSLFGLAGSELIVANLSDLTMISEPLTSLNGPSAIAVDDVDTATVLDTDPDTQRTRATRLQVGATPPMTSQVLVGPSTGAAGTVALSRKAMAMAFNAGNVTLFTTALFP